TGIKTRNWRELAYERDWQGAIIGYLREKWREAIPLWTVLNGICAAAKPRDRRETRELKTEILKALGHLSRTRKVLRLRRTKLAILDIGDNRRAMLCEMIDPLLLPGVHVTESVPACGRALFVAAMRTGLEGVM